METKLVNIFGCTQRAPPLQPKTAGLRSSYMKAASRAKISIKKRDFLLQIQNIFTEVRFVFTSLTIFIITYFMQILTEVYFYVFIIGWLRLTLVTPWTAGGSRPDKIKIFINTFLGTKISLNSVWFRVLKIVTFRCDFR